MRQLNILRNSSKFKIRTLRLSAKSRPTERRQLLLHRRRVSVLRKLLLLLTLMRAVKIKREQKLRSKRLPLPMPLLRMRTEDVLLPSIARARKSKIAILTRKCARFVVLS
jgi:hypothetical protein